jgi:hypothetical protein
MSPEAAQEAQAVKAKYGATHYATMRDGVTPQMYYKQEYIIYNDNTSELVWVYLSYANLWMGSSITEAEVLKLKAID